MILQNQAILQHAALIVLLNATDAGSG